MVFQNFKKGRPATDIIKDRALLESLGVKVPDKYWNRASLKEMLFAIDAVLVEDMMEDMMEDMRGCAKEEAVVESWAVRYAVLLARERCWLST